MTWKKRHLDETLCRFGLGSLAHYGQSEEAIPSTGLAVAEMVAEETASVEAETPAPVSQPAAPVQTTSAAIDDDDLVSDIHTLQLRISLSEPVKLDATMEDRTLFRKLRDELKAKGYRFNAVDQSWILAE